MDIFRRKCINVINDLPDELLVHILSFLSTKESFRTSILSSRWKNLWTMVPSLDFQQPSRYDKDEDSSYSDFIEKVFMSHNSFINKFHIEQTTDVDMSRLEAWISILVERNVRYISMNYFDMYMRLPESLFTCKTLVSLKLRSRLQLDNIPQSIHFPSLKVLELILANPSSVLTQKLFSSSPVLEELNIHAIYRSSGKFVYDISCPSLKKLLVSIDNDNRYDDIDCVVNVDAPVLEFFTIKHVLNAHFMVKNSPALIKARLISFEKGSDFPYEKLVMLLESVPFVKDLFLGGYLPMRVFGICFEKKWPAFPIVTYLTLDIKDNFDSWSLSRCPTFPNLIYLRLNLHSHFDFKDFPKILSSAPNLSTLVINEIFRSEEFNSLELAEAPNCLCWHVKEIELLEYEGHNVELKMIKYLLENARALEKLTIKIWCNASLKGDWYKHKKEIFMLPKSSKKCQILFI